MFGSLSSYHLFFLGCGCDWIGGTNWWCWWSEIWPIVLLRTKSSLQQTQNPRVSNDITRVMPALIDVTPKQPAHDVMMRRPDSKDPKDWEKWASVGSWGIFQVVLAPFCFTKTLDFPQWLGAVCGQRCRINADAQTLVTWSKGMWSTEAVGKWMKMLPIWRQLCTCQLSTCQRIKTLAVGNSVAGHCEKTEREIVHGFLGILGESHGRGHSNHTVATLHTHSPWYMIIYI